MGQEPLQRNNQQQKEKVNKGHYNGDCDDMGRPHGKGQMNYADGSTFAGHFQYGFPHEGTFIYPNKNKYIGQLKDNQPHGEGEWHQAKGVFKGEFNDGQFISGTVKYKDNSVYTGYMRDGQKHGQNCQYTFPDGDRFTGEYKLDQFHEGIYTKKGGFQYKGSFYQNKKSGQGELLINGILKYVGNFADDQFEGEGKLQNYKNNTVYEGQFKRGKKHGKGKLIDAKGHIYTGQFHQNEKNGKGVYDFRSKKYEGEFKSNKFDGYGVYSYENGNRYEGNFLQNKKHGYGKLHLNTNEEYEGYFENDNMEGEGKLIHENQDRYEGSFKENKKHGKGLYHNVSKDQTYEGVWNMDVKNGYFIETRNNERLVLKGNYINGEKDGQFLIQTFDSKELPKLQNWNNGKRSVKEE